MNRDEMKSRLEAQDGPWDVLVIGGGATGVGVAVDAAARGYDVLLLEQSDFGKGTSSRSTKLIHGGVRYLQQGNVPLVSGKLGRELSIEQGYDAARLTGQSFGKEFHEGRVHRRAGPVRQNDHGVRPGRHRSAPHPGAPSSSPTPT